MEDRAGKEHEEAPRRGRLATAALRALDACLGALQRLRARLAPPEEEVRGAGRRGAPAPEPPPAAEPPPRRRGLLHRTLVVLMCLLLGGVAGMGFSFRELSAVLDSRAAALERMQEELDQSKRQEARNRNLLDRLQKEKAEMRLETREARREAEDYRERVGELEKQLAAQKRIERPAAGAAVHSTARPVPRAKSGTCVVGPGQPGGDLTECLDRFNRP